MKNILVLSTVTFSHLNWEKRSGIALNDTQLVADLGLQLFSLYFITKRTCPFVRYWASSYSLPIIQSSLLRASPPKKEEKINSIFLVLVCLFVFTTMTHVLYPEKLYLTYIREKGPLILFFSLHLTRSLINLKICCLNPRRFHLPPAFLQESHMTSIERGSWYK